MYTVEDLKSKYKKFSEAKDHFQIKAGSWQKLCDKLNAESQKDAQIRKLETEIKALRSELSKTAAKSDLDILLTDLVYPRGVGSDEVFESPEALENEPEDTGRDDWAYFESVLKRRYYRLAKRYHPDNGGSEAQMNNLINAYEVGRTFVKSNGGLDK
ncbi:MULTISPECIES: J domain-containing protein [Leptolyngbya]|uniref:J domain-containing protein n=1 Tax=Leptolyngbya TaxID=47251 RepID=UPI001687DE55|nr:J domain-containing protein [Leptolyngbya sp. FACHB-1624]MBD1856462.1 J domain-containing protein [Leptolyngbya sp. FACHB-1624]